MTSTCAAPAERISSHPARTSPPSPDPPPPPATARSHRRFRLPSGPSRRVQACITGRYPARQAGSTNQRPSISTGKWGVTRAVSEGRCGAAKPRPPGRGYCHSRKTSCVSSLHSNSQILNPKSQIPLTTPSARRWRRSRHGDCLQFVRVAGLPGYSGSTLCNVRCW